MAKGYRGAFVLIAFMTLVMTAAGSLLLGYEFGEIALEGVRPPEGDDSATGDSPQMALIRRGVPLVEETLVLSTAQTQIAPPSDRLVSNAPVTVPVATPFPTPTATPTRETSPELAAPPPLTTNVPPLAFPTQIAAEVPPPDIAPTGDVAMQVLSASRQGDQVVLTVSLSNSSDRVVRFLYSFMNVTDDQGRPVSANTQGLPGELPPNGQSYQGTITIPSLFLQDSSTVSLSLPDYPSQNVRLQVSGIAIQ